jgi:lipopolysaccharide transport system ATP-binding protein
MTQREIQRKFEEIVAFAEVERFLDTPVKHYSSGMYVRLAFAVAAHLEPEILIVDEVLAVGDAEFQKKCLGKMDEVSRKQGRTVLFVSHNMEAVLKLCTRGLFLEKGYVRANGDVKTIVPAYLSSQSASPREVDLLSMPRPTHFTGKARLAKASPSDPGSSWSFPFGKELSLDVSIEAQTSATGIQVAIAVCSIRGFAIAAWTNKCSKIVLPVHAGINTFRILFKHLLLLPGQYILGIGLDSGRGFEEWFPEAIQFEITPTPETADMNVDALGGSFLPAATVSVLA